MKTINGKEWKAALISGANAMSNNKSRIDGMNVFPVPDGDTGSNMAATIEYAISEITKLPANATVGEVAAKFARGMLLGARGNSGVILSQIFKGIAVGFENKKEIKAEDIINALKQAKSFAYKSVMKPVEGTMLTVIRIISEKMKTHAKITMSIEDIFALMIKFGREACDYTPELLPILKEVGVTDSGGEGFFTIIDGIYKHLQGNSIQINQQASAPVGDFIFNGQEDFAGEYGYCTEFIVNLKSPKGFKKDRFQAALEKMGNSIVIVMDEDILKVHLHTLNPGSTLTFAQKFGEFMKIKSENMTLQANETSLARQKQNPSPNKSKNDKLAIGVISCNTGPGIIMEMKNLGTDFIIASGQSANPSASDFIEAIKKLNTNKIILLPNNSNIIMAAQQAASISDKEVLVIPSKTQMEGIAAIMNFDREMTLQDNKESMNEGINSVKTGQVTKAARSTKINGVSVKKDEYLAIAGKKILKSHKTKTKAAIDICKKLIDDDSEIVTIYYGDDSSLVDAEEISNFIEANYAVDVEIKEGKQPIYNFLIAFE